MVYYAYFHSAMMYVIIFLGNSRDSNKVFLQQKRTVRTILGINPRRTCKPRFKTLGILTMPSQYILSFMEFLINNLAYFSLNSEIHNKFTRNMMCRYVLQINLSLYQGVYYISIKVFNSLPNCTADFMQNKKKFMGKLKSVLMKESFLFGKQFFRLPWNVMRN